MIFNTAVSSLWYHKELNHILTLKGPRKAVFVCKGTLKIDPIMKVLCITWPLKKTFFFFFFKVSLFTKEDMHADQAEFLLLVLISKYARDPWRRSLTSQTDTEANGEWGAFSPSIGPQRKCHANVRPWDAQSCRPKGRCFPFTPSRKIAVEGSFNLGDSNWKLFQVGYPVDTHTEMNLLLRVSVTHRAAFARLILGRWKERSLQMKPPSLPILQGIYPDRPKDSEIHVDTLVPLQILKLKKGKNLFHKKPYRKWKGNQQKRKMYTQILSKNELVINAEVEKVEKEGRKRKQTKKPMDMVNTETKKEKQEVQLLNYQ